MLMSPDVSADLRFKSVYHHAAYTKPGTSSYICLLTSGVSPIEHAACIKLQGQALTLTPVYLPEVQVCRSSRSLHQSARPGDWLLHLSAYLRCKSVDHHAASIKLRSQVLTLTPVCQQACQGTLPALDPTPGCIAQPIERRQPSITPTCLRMQQQVGR